MSNLFNYIKLIECDDWDAFIMETYGKPYCFQQQEWCRERGIYKFSVPEGPYEYERDTIPDEINGKVKGVRLLAWMNRDINEWNGEEEDRSLLRMFWERNFYPSIESLVDDLYKKGLIESGSYAINIDW